MTHFLNLLLPVLVCVFYFRRTDHRFLFFFHLFYFFHYSPIYLGPVHSFGFY